MPIYEFECPKCGNIDEMLLDSKDIERIYCSKCHGQAAKVMSASNIQVKGNYTAANGYSQPAPESRAAESAGCRRSRPLRM